MLSKRNRDLIGFFAAGIRLRSRKRGLGLVCSFQAARYLLRPASCNVEARASAVACGNIGGNVNIPGHRKSLTAPGRCLPIAQGAVDGLSTGAPLLSLWRP